MNIKKIASIFVLIFIFSNNFIYSRKMKLSKDYYRPLIDKKCWFTLEKLATVLENHPEISYEKYLEKTPFDFQPFPPSRLYPHKGICSNCFILRIPQGKVQGPLGHIFVDSTMIEEMIWQGLFQPLMIIPQIPQEDVICISGRVAVIAQPLYSYYFHWLQDLLGRLALLEMHGIEYDYLYVPTDKKFMKETLELWGIDPQKIITPDSSKFCIQADELIIPSFVVNKNEGFNKYAGFHQNPLTGQYVSKKLIEAAQAKNIDTAYFSKRIFVSRKDAPRRKILNEDEIFELFETKGFSRYQLSELSVAEQVLLFNNAEMIVGEHGAGMANCLFCKPNTQVIEIFQALVDSGPWWITQIMHLDYRCIQTVKVNADYFAHFALKPEIYQKAWLSQMVVTTDAVKKVVESIEA